MSRVIPLAALFATSWFAMPLNAQIFTYSFSDVVSGSTSSAGGTVNNLIFSSFTASGVSAGANAANAFSFTGWTTGATTGSNSFSGGLDTTDYFQFSITPSSGYELTLSNLTFGAGRSSTGPRQFVVRSSMDGFTSNLSASVSDNTNMSVVSTNVFQIVDNSTTATFSGNTVTLTDGSFTNLTVPVTFRIYAFNAEATGGSFRIDDFSVFGSATAIPEPSTYAAIIGAAALGAAAWHRRRRVKI